MKVYSIYYDLYYEKERPLISGSYQMYVENIREIFDKAFALIKENEEGCEERTFEEENLTGFDFHFQVAKNQQWVDSPSRKMTYSLKPKGTKRKPTKPIDTTDTE